MFKIKVRNSNDFFVYSAAVFGIIVVGSGFLASIFPPIGSATLFEMQKLVVTLDGVLFGFTGVMIAYFMKNVPYLSEKTTKSALFLTILAFFSYIFSMLYIFIAIAIPTVVLPPFGPVILMLCGATCSSIYLMLTFIDEVFPEKIGTIQSKTETKSQELPDQQLNQS